MFRLIIGLAAAVFVGKLAVKSWGSMRTVAIVNRAFWVLWLLWSALVLYSASTATNQGGLAVALVVAPLIARYLVVFIVRGRL